MTAPRRVAVAFGSNLGDRRHAIQTAADRVAALLGDFRLSSMIETAAVGSGRANDPPFLNAVGVGVSDAPARELLQALLAIEEEFGRTRPFPGAPRIIDLDLILAGDDEVHEPELEVPHPRFRERRFVLGPLAEIAPDFSDPVTGQTVESLLKQLDKEPGPKP